MKRDLDVVPGAKLAMWVAITLGSLLFLGYSLGYPIAWIYASHKNNKEDVGVAEFYGIVKDPRGAPIQGVAINAKFSIYSFFGGRRDKKLSAETDENGEFSFGPRKAISLELYEFNKIGYVVRGRRWPKDGWQYWVFRFSPHMRDKHIPNPSVPFGFTMEPKSEP